MLALSLKHKERGENAKRVDIEDGPEPSRGHSEHQQSMWSVKSDGECTHSDLISITLHRQH